MLATTKGNNLASIKLLIEAGADVRLVNKDGWTSFHLAVRTGDLSLLAYLLATDPECSVTVSRNGRTPLYTACLAGLLHVVRWLLLLDTAVNCPDYCGSTPVMDAARGDHLDCVQSLLVRRELDLSVHDRYSLCVVMVTVTLYVGWGMVWCRWLPSLEL